MITKERLEQISKSIMATAITNSGFSAQFNELRGIKTYMQNQIADEWSEQETFDVVFSRRNEGAIEKLIALGKRLYGQAPTEERAFMIAMSIGTIVKEYGWGMDLVSGDGFCNLVNRILD